MMITIGKSEYACHRIVMYSMLLYPICSVCQKAQFFDLMSKALIVILCFALFCLYCIKRQSLASWIVILGTLLLNVLALAYPISPKEGIATYFMYIIWVLFFLYLANNKDAIKKIWLGSLAKFKCVIFIWQAIVLVSFFIPSSYESTWGEGRYFMSFSTTSFELAPAAMMILSFVIFLQCANNKKRETIALSLIPAISVFASGSRTYLVLVLLEVAVLARVMIKSKSLFLFSVLALGLVAFGMIQISNIGEKFFNAFEYIDNSQAFWSIFTNGRNAFWAADIGAYLDSNAFQLLFGHGYSYVYDINEQLFELRIYAHNDFLNILLNFGLLGLVPYFYAIIHAIRVYSDGCTNSMLLLFVVIWLFNAFFNMAYVYLAAIFGMGILLQSFSVLHDQHCRIKTL